ncbi:spore germination protein GerW family protein [Nocardia pseudobrasiliensis]|uniref:Sporulation protein YtfJ n=1 Tax=Nocardia pseudobrasiliensis TaxID=45979 RepID=A0A370IC44_9NOCA|nr:spore germination protein GerW family protein [Nocardia pseudobrasiliensis]RDI68277.1 sporulation protein YtfJ [Nocardia pseudobrasiliensis]
MNLDEIFAAAKDSMTVRRVFAEPVEKDGVTVIAAATISGGVGGGGGTDGEGQEGSGGGFGVGAKPAGVYVVRDGKVSWQPAVDVNRLMTVVGVVAVTALIVGAHMAKWRARLPM